MSSIDDRAKAMQGRWFIIALLLALASALVPALCSHGLPSSRSVGSAFDPTTSAVTLRGREQVIARTEIARPDEGRGGKAPPARIVAALLTTISVMTSLAAFAYPAALAASLPALRKTLRRMTPAQPRAPPLPAA
jgi:hypothetical protein